MTDNTLPERLCDIWICPTTGRVIEGLLGDDKVLCGCGVSNPRVPQERTRETGVHIKRFLQPATREQWQEQVFREVRRG